MTSPLSRLALTALLTAPALWAQGPNTHLNVPAKQMVRVWFNKNIGDPTGVYSYFNITYPGGEWLGNTIPAGYALVLMDLNLRVPNGSATAVSPGEFTLWIHDVATNQPTSLRVWSSTFTVPAGATWTQDKSFSGGVAFTPLKKPAISVTGGLGFANVYATGYLIAY